MVDNRENLLRIADERRRLAERLAAEADALEEAADFEGRDAELAQSHKTRRRR